MSRTEEHPVASPTDPQTLLGQAARWRLLGRLFERPQEGWARDVRGLIHELDDPGLEALARGVAESGESSYLRVFGPGGSVSPREVAYRPMHDPGRILAELNGTYRAFAYRPDAEDPADHVAIETGFVGWLYLKEAYARYRGESSNAEVAALARKTFVDEHLAHLAAELPARLEATGAALLAAAVATLHVWCGEPVASRPSLNLVHGGRLAAAGPDVCGACPGPEGEPGGP
jgi:hypothetical protein